MVQKGKLMKGRKKRLDEVSLFINKSNDKVDYFEVSDVFKVSPYQARIDLTYLVRKKKIPMEKIYGYEEGTNFLGEVIFRHEKKGKKHGRVF